MRTFLKIVLALIVMAVIALSTMSSMEIKSLFGFTNPTVYRVGGGGGEAAVPFDHHWYQLARGHSVGWQEVSDFYGVTAAQERDTTYFPALQMEIIGHLVEKTYFMHSGPEDLQRYYLRELADRAYLPRPDVALALVQSLWDNSGAVDVELYNFSQSIEANNREYLGEKAFTIHYERYAETYQTLESLGDLGR